MVEEADNLILAHLKGIRASLTRIEEDIRDIKMRLVTLEQWQAEGYQAYARQQSAIDKIGCPGFPH